MSGRKSVPRIGIGYRVGHLTVEAKTDEKHSGYVVWRCRCDCGGEICLDTRFLQRGATTDCGCMTRVKPGQKDLTGMRFGKLICLEATDQRSKSGSVMWRCICDCGKECLAASKQLQSGYRKSCGCLSRPPLKEFTGKRFGQLVVTEYAGKHGGIHYWKCICDCGKETVVRQTLLQSGKTKSCGCLQASIITENLKLFEGTSVTMLESTRKKRLSNNTSGYTGIYKNRLRDKWVAQITFKKKTYHLGSFDKIEDAVKARIRGEEMHDDFLEWYYSQYGKDKNAKKEDKKTE